MAETTRDALGQALSHGDHIAHSAVRGSAIRITRRRVVDMRDNQIRMTGMDWRGEPNAKVSPWASAYNVVKVSAP